MNTTHCPDCNGTGAMLALHVRYDNGESGYNLPVTCFRCGGKRQVPRQMLAWMELGQQCKVRRVALGFGMREFAELHQMLPSEVAGMENGRLHPAPLLKILFQ